MTRGAGDGRAGDGRVSDRGAGDRGAGDQGSATVLAAAAIGVIGLVLALGLALGAAVLTRQRAENAADLAALAAASDAARGRDVACARADDTARANRARLASCDWSGWVVDVQAEVGCRCLPTVSGIVVARARAGPIVNFDTPNARSPATHR